MGDAFAVDTIADDVMSLEEGDKTVGGNGDPEKVGGSVAMMWAGVKAEREGFGEDLGIGGVFCFGTVLRAGLGVGVGVGVGAGFGVGVRAGFGGYLGMRIGQGEREQLLQVVVPLCG